MSRSRGPRRMRPHRRMRDLAEFRLLGVVLVVAGMALMFLCIPGWAWAALAGAALVAAGCWLVMLDVR